MPAAYVVQKTVVCLSNQSVDRTDALVSFLSQGVTDQRVDRCGYTKGIGQYDRRLQIPQFLHLTVAGQLAETVSQVYGRRHLGLEHIAGMGKDRCGARPDTVALYQGKMPHPDATHIRYGVPGAWFHHPYADPDIAGPLFLLCFHLKRQNTDEKKKN